MGKQVVQKRVGDEVMELQEGTPIGEARVWYREPMSIPTNKVSLKNIEQIVEGRQALAPRPENSDVSAKELIAEINAEIRQSNTDSIDTKTVPTKNLSLF